MIGGIYLSPEALTVGGLWFGVWTLVAIALGMGIGKAIREADEREGVNERAEATTDEITLGFEQFSRSSTYGESA